jgi:DNA-binding SARP family transcriptional activator
MDFRILGPVEATAGGAPLRIGGPRQRALLAYLLLNANTTMSAEHLVEELWVEPPSGGHAALQTQVSRLRGVLGDRIETTGTGYGIRVESGELDLDRFRSLLAEAGAAATAQDRSRFLREADAEWHGVPFAGLDVPFAVGEAAALEELRLATQEDRIDADLESGLHAELVPELAALVARHPLRERLRGQQMLALYRCGRQADALEAYADLRRRLDDELGLEPGPRLRELQVAILRHDPALLLVAAAPPSPPVAPAQPRRGVRRVILAAMLALLAVAGGAAAATLALSRSAAGPHAAAPPAAARRPRTAHRAVVRQTPTVRPVHHARRRVVPPPATTAVASSAPPATTHATTTSSTPKTTPPPKPTEKTQPTDTQTTPIRTTPSAPTTTISDDFSETTPNTKVWGTWGDGTGYAWSLQNGELVFTVPAAAVTGGKYDMVGPAWGTVCRFGGDFDERVDYQLLEWPQGVGGHAQMTAWIFPDDNSAVGRTGTKFGDQYNGDIGEHFTLLNTADTSGTLRLARTDGVLTAYYFDHGDWVAIQSATAKGQAMLGLQLFGMSTDWTHQEIQVAFDNFKVTASDVVCP